MTPRPPRLGSDDYIRHIVRTNRTGAEIFHNNTHGLGTERWWVRVWKDGYFIKDQSVFHATHADAIKHAARITRTGVRP